MERLFPRLSKLLAGRHSRGGEDPRIGPYRCAACRKSGGERDASSHRFHQEQCDDDDRLLLQYLVVVERKRGRNVESLTSICRK